MYLIIDKIRFIKIILLRLIICYLVKLKYCHLGHFEKMTACLNKIGQKYKYCYNLYNNTSELDMIA